jgi:hypothetical protein
VGAGATACRPSSVLADDACRSGPVQYQHTNVCTSLHHCMAGWLVCDDGMDVRASTPTHARQRVFQQC